MDPIIESIKSARRQTTTAIKAVNDDLRTAGSDAESLLRRAEDLIKQAGAWVVDLSREEAEAAKPDPTPKAARTRAYECMVCGAPAGSDPSICSGCGKPVCDGCMGDEEYCIDCQEGEE